MSTSGINLVGRRLSGSLTVVFCVGLMLAADGHSAAGADRFLDQETKAREQAVQADRDGRLDDAIGALKKAIDLRLQGARLEIADDKRWLRELNDEKTLRARAHELDARGQVDAAAAAVEELITLRNRRLGGKGVPESAADRRWLTDLKNRQVTLISAGFDVLREYQDRWFDRRLEFHDGGELADAIAKKEAELKELTERVGKDHPDSVRLKSSIDEARQARAKKIEELTKLAQAQMDAYRSGDLADATVQARFGLKLRREVYGDADLTVGVCAAEAARIEINRGELFATSTTLLDEAATVFRTQYGDRHWRVRDIEIQKREKNELGASFEKMQKQSPLIRAHIEFCQVLIEKGRFFDAIDVANKDQTFLDSYAAGRPLTLTARTLLNQAAILRAMGLHARSVPIQARAIAMIRELFGDEHPEMVSALVNQTGAYRELGDLGQALLTARRAGEFCGPVWGKEHIESAACLRNLAEVLTELEQPSEARPIVVAALKIAEADFKRYGDDWTKSFRLLAEIEFRLGHWENARNYFAHALKNQATSPGRSHPAYIVTLGRLASAEHILKQYDKSEALFREAVELSEKVRGKNHPTHAELLANFARVYQDRGDFQQAESLLETALKISRKHLDSTFAVLSERQQLTMTKAASAMLSDYIAVAHRNQRSATDVYSLALGWKGAVIARQQQARATTSDPKSLALRKQLDDLSRRLAALVLSVPDPAQKIGRDKLIEDLSAQKDRLEGDLTALGGSSTKHRVVTLKEVQAAVPSGAVLVDDYEYRDVVADPNSTDRGYLLRLTAFIVQADQEILQVDLGPTAFIQEAADKWRQAVMRGGGGVSRGLTLLPQKKTSDPEPQVELRRLLWRPIEERLDPKAIVLLSPDSVVSNIPFAALPGTESGRYLIEERGIVLIPSPILLPSLLGNDKPHVDDQSVLLIGDVDFGGPPGTTLIADRSLEPVVRSAPRSAGLSFQPLPGTARETTRIFELHAQHFQNVPRRRLTGADATERDFRASATTSRILHIATHGFFGALASPTGPAANAPAAGAGPAINLHPGLSSGIALTGANRGSSAAEGDEVTDDGILTALEAAALDLSGTDMVVLSACETGLGTSAGGEGLLSLQRAFQVAGVKSTVTSLWKVDDAATQSLMVEFYRNLWEKRLGKLEALRQAQLAMIEHYDPKKQTLRDRGLKLLNQPAGPEADKRLSPYFWAAFTLGGDWR